MPGMPTQPEVVLAEQRIAIRHLITHVDAGGEVGIAHLSACRPTAVVAEQGAGADVVAQAGEFREATIGVDGSGDAYGSYGGSLFSCRQIR